VAWFAKSCQTASGTLLALPGALLVVLLMALLVVPLDVPLGALLAVRLACWSSLGSHTRRG